MTSFDQLQSQADTWYVEHDGGRAGPMSRAAVLAMIRGGKLSARSLVWKSGFAQWVPLGDTEFGSEFRDTPPPLDSGRVPNGLIWLLAFAPILGLFIEGLIAGVRREPIGHYWWVTLALNIALSLADERRLKAAGYSSKGWGAALVVPVYMYQRAETLRQKPWYLVVWVLCFLAVIAA